LIFEREDMLNGLGAAGVGLEEGLERTADLGEATVGGFAVVVVARGPVETVECGGDLEDLAADFQELAVENRGGFAGLEHRSGLLGLSTGTIVAASWGVETTIIPDRGSARKLLILPSG
jgi:hypothetical protein